MSIRYSVDGYVIADDVKRDDDWTAEVENNFPLGIGSHLQSQRLGRGIR